MRHRHCGHSHIVDHEAVPQLYGRRFVHRSADFSITATIFGITKQNYVHCVCLAAEFDSTGATRFLGPREISEF